MATGRGAPRPRFRLLPTVLLTAAILALPTAVYAWGRSSSTFAVREVAVAGAQFTPAGSLVRQLRRSFLGANLFSIGEGDVSEAFAAFPYVAQVDVDRDFPAALRVTVVEHQPAAYVLGPGGWYVTADDGYVILRLGASGGTASAGASGAAEAEPSAGAADEPAVTPSPSPSTAAAAGSGVQSGVQAAAETPARLQRLRQGPPKASLRLPRFVVSAEVKSGAYLSDRRTRSILTVIGALPDALRRRLTIVEATPEGQLTLRLSPELEVAWGDAQRSRAKTIALRTVMARYAAAGTTPTFIDVTVPDRVLARPILK